MRRSDSRLRHHHQILRQQVRGEERALTEDHPSSVNSPHSVHEWTQVGPCDQAVGKRVTPMCFLPHLREVVVGAAAAAGPLLQAEEGVEEHFRMKVAVGAEEEVVVEAEEEENPRIKVEGMANY